LKENALPDAFEMLNLLPDKTAIDLVESVRKDEKGAVFAKLSMGKNAYSDIHAALDKVKDDSNAWSKFAEYFPKHSRQEVYLNKAYEYKDPEAIVLSALYYYMDAFGDNPDARDKNLKKLDECIKLLDGHREQREVRELRNKFRD
jgi:hypothetical protein